MLPGYKKELDMLRKAHGEFYWYEVAITFMERDVFHDKRRNLNVYEKLSVDSNVSKL
jgi:hypothetical protein